MKYPDFRSGAGGAAALTLLLLGSAPLRAGEPAALPDQQGRPGSRHCASTHVWAKRSGRWQLIAAHISEVKQR
jgi:hypothetical protein